MAKELPTVPEHFLEAEICDKEKEGHTSLAKLLLKVWMVATMIMMVVATKEDCQLMLMTFIIMIMT
jgi:hypothetical protein